MSDVFAAVREESESRLGASRVDGVEGNEPWYN